MHILSQDPCPPVVPLRMIDHASLGRLRASASPTVKRWLEYQRFQARFGSHAVICDEQGKMMEVWVGTEAPPDDPRRDLILFATLAAALPPSQIYAVVEERHAELNLEWAALGWGLADYRFTGYRQTEKEALPRLNLPPSLDLAAVTRLLETIFWVRDLINTPPNDMGPEELCREADHLARRFSAELHTIKGNELLDKGFPAIHAVGRGSGRPPALIDLRWGDPSHPRLTLVGKGVVFDSGGLSLKSNSNMVLMKKDMGGAAVALGLSRLVMAGSLPVRLRLLIPAVENTPGPDSYRPGDIIETRKGLRVEIGNTDAEGRIILCDALAEAAAEKPDLIIDLATLTGACRVALGPEVSGFWTDSDLLGDALMRASHQCADPIWRMPLWHPYLAMMKSPVADLNNSASHGQGGAISAALFLYQFLKPHQNWAHFDINAWSKDPMPGSPRGGEAHALRAIYRFLENRYLS